MKKTILLTILLAFTSTIAYSQTKPTAGQSRPAPVPAASPQPTGVQQRQPASFNISEYGVSFQTEPRLIIMMAALDAAGFDPTPSGGEPSVFRAQVRKDLADLDPDLRSRLRTFYERNKLPAPATAADQAARYVRSLRPWPTAHAGGAGTI